MTSAREPSAEAVTADAADTHGSTAERALSPLEPLTARSLLSLQRHAGNRAAGALIARQARLQRAGGLLKPQKVQEVYGYWLLELAKAQGPQRRRQLDRRGRPGEGQGTGG